MNLIMSRGNSIVAKSLFEDCFRKLGFSTFETGIFFVTL